MTWAEIFCYLSTQQNSSFLPKMNFKRRVTVKSRQEKFLAENLSSAFDWLRSWIKAADWSIMPKFKFFAGFLNWDSFNTFLKILFYLLYSVKIVKMTSQSVFWNKVINNQAKIYLSIIWIIH